MILFFGRVAREKEPPRLPGARGSANNMDSTHPGRCRTRHEGLVTELDRLAPARSGRPRRPPRRARLRRHRRGARGGSRGGQYRRSGRARGAGCVGGSPGPGAIVASAAVGSQSPSRPAGRPALRDRRCRWLRGPARGDVGRSGLHPGAGRQRFERARGRSFQPYVEATDRFLDRTMRAFDGPISSGTGPGRHAAAPVRRRAWPGRSRRRRRRPRSVAV